jgi:nucleoid DNA-binding protein
MGKIFMSDLADRLAEQTGMSKRDAQQFLSAVVETIQEGVNNDKIVKIKGLGTFKVIDVEARESVNVNTGERVTIDSHQKLTFTPDSAMKDLVNKPFSQFETVVLNDGVDFDDVKTESSEEAKVLEKHDEIEESKELETSNVIEMHEEPVASEELVASEEPVASEESIASEKSEVEVPETPEVPETVENPIEPEVLKVADTTEVTSEIPEEAKVSEPVDSKQSYWWLWLLLAIVACVCSFAGGYILGRNIDRNSICDEEDSKADTTITAVVNCQDTLTVSTQNNDTLKADVQEISKQKTDSVNSDVLTKKTDEVAPDWKKYEDMDSRVRTGAYRIVGTDRVVKVKSGETMKRIANRILGEGMECYVEVYNNISSGQALKEGQEIKIPKLELKKKRKKE